MTYQLLADCISSDQLSAQQIAESMRDKVFRRWYEERYGL